MYVKARKTRIKYAGKAERLISLAENTPHPAQRGWKGCTNRATAVTRSGDTMSSSINYNLAELQDDMDGVRAMWQSSRAALGALVSCEDTGSGGDAALQALASNNNPQHGGHAC